MGRANSCLGLSVTGLMGGDAGWPAHSCQGHWVKWPGCACDPGWPKCQAPSGEAAGQPGSGAGHRALPGAPDGCLHTGVLAARAESPAEPCSWPSSQLFSLTLFFLEDEFCRPHGPWPSAAVGGGAAAGAVADLDSTPRFLPPLSLFGAKAGKWGLKGSQCEWRRGDRERTCLATVSPAQDCSQLPAQDPAVPTKCP